MKKHLIFIGILGSLLSCTGQPSGGDADSLVQFLSVLSETMRLFLSVLSKIIYLFLSVLSKFVSLRPERM